MKFIAGIVRSKIWVSLAAALMTLETAEIHRTQYGLLHAIHVFFLTLAAYLFLDHESGFWRRPLIYLSVTGSVLGFLLLPLTNLPLLVLAGILVLTYQTGWTKELGYRFPFEWRSIPLLKNTVIAASWILLTNLYLIQGSAAEMMFLMTGNFLFILVLSVAEDIMDHDRDQTNTLPKALGLRGAGVIATLLIICSVFSYIQMEMQQLEVLYVVVDMLVVALVWSIQSVKNRDVASLLIDGIMILRSMLVLLII